MLADGWRAEAQCVGADPARYVLDEPPHYLPPNAVRQRTAEALCEGCPVARECAYEALLKEDVGVVRGGVWLGAKQAAQHRERLARAAGVQLP